MWNRAVDLEDIGEGGTVFEAQNDDCEKEETQALVSVVGLLRRHT